MTQATKPIATVDAVPKTKEDITMWLKELDAHYDRHKSFYKKAFVIGTENGTITLRSYDTFICRIHKYGEIECFGTYSRTTTRHIVEFLHQYQDMFKNRPEYAELIKTNYSLNELRKIIAQTKKGVTWKTDIEGIYD